MIQVVQRSKQLNDPNSSMFQAVQQSKEHNDPRSSTIQTVHRFKQLNDPSSLTIQTAQRCKQFIAPSSSIIQAVYCSNQLNDRINLTIQAFKRFNKSSDHRIHWKGFLIMSSTCSLIVIRTSFIFVDIMIGMKEYERTIQRHFTKNCHYFYVNIVEILLKQNFHQHVRTVNNNHAWWTVMCIWGLFDFNFSSNLHLQKPLGICLSTLSSDAQNEWRVCNSAHEKSRP